MNVINSVFAVANNQLLKMEWLDRLVQLLVEKVFGLDMAGRLGGSIHFYLYDTVKIFILLSLLIFSISYIQSYFPPERTRKILGGLHGIRANLLGALLGTVTPFCSCSSIPIFIGFTSAGLPVGVTFSFLISSPLVDLASVLLLASIFGWKIAFAYVAVGIVLAVTGGTVISGLKLEQYVEPFVFNQQAGDAGIPEMTRRERQRFAKEQVFAIIHIWNVAHRRGISGQGSGNRNRPVFHDGGYGPVASVTHFAEESRQDPTVGYLRSDCHHRDHGDWLYL
jgi:uncharacterized membrane protein YraQ (UPF0718 family)